MPKKISEVFGVSDDDLKKEGVFNGFTDLDSKFYVDPHLLENTKVPELQDSYLNFKEGASSGWGSKVEGIKDGVQTVDQSDH